MDFSATRIPTLRGLRLEGELDMATVDRLTGLLDEAASPGGPVFLDLTALRFMDSTGLQQIVKAFQAVATSGWCLFLHIDDGEIARLLDLMGVALAPNIHVIDHRGAKTPRPVKA